MSPHPLVLCFALAAGVASAQGRDGLEIRGVVLEPGNELAVAGAEVTLYEFVRDADNSRVVFASALTDVQGAFHLRLLAFSATC